MTITTSWTVEPTKEELEAHDSELKTWRENAIREIREDSTKSEGQKNQDIELIESRLLDTKLIACNLLCDKCGEYAVKAYDDHLNYTVTRCDKCNHSYDFLDKEYKIFYSMFAKATYRKHNLEETSWGKIVENEISVLRKTRDTIGKEIERLENMLDGVEEEEKQK